MVNQFNVLSVLAGHLSQLTLEQAKAYAADPEKFTHVTDNYLDVWGIKRSPRFVEVVEDRFEQLLAGAR